MFNLNAFLSPKLAREYPENSKERSICSSAIKVQWHVIFDDLPNLIDSIGEESGILLESFLEWSDEKNLSMDWKLHLYMLYWIKQKSGWSKKIEEIHHREFLAASLFRWASNNMDDRDINGIIVSSVFTGERITMGIFRTKKYGDKLKAEILKTPLEVLPKQGLHTAYLKGHTYNEKVVWHPLEA